MKQEIKLPEPKKDGTVSLESTLSQRRSVREFTDKELTSEEISQILWAAQGMTNSVERLRTAPSAGALYPLEVYVANKDGIFQYRADRNVLVQQSGEDVRKELRKAALHQMFIEQASCVFVLTSVYKRTTRKYDERGIRYVHMETGHTAQNILLQAVALGLGGVLVGAFNDHEIARILNLAEKKEKPLYLIPVGEPKTNR